MAVQLCEMIKTHISSFANPVPCALASKEQSLEIEGKMRCHLSKLSVLRGIAMEPSLSLHRAIGH